MSEEALQTAEKRREAKGNGEKERYTHLNTEFQRIARRDKKAFLSEQCKEIDEHNRTGETRDLKKMRDTKETFHVKMSTVKDRNSKELTEALLYINTLTKIWNSCLLSSFVQLIGTHQGAMRPSS